MSRSAVQFLLLVLLAGFSLFLGIDIASRNGSDAAGVAAGRDREVFQPLPVPVGGEEKAISPAARSSDPGVCGERVVLCPDRRPEQGREPAIARIGNGIGDLFHRTAYHAVDGVTSLLSRLTD